MKVFLGCLNIDCSGQVTIRVNQTFPLENCAEAHRQLEARETTGSTILKI